VTTKLRALCAVFIVFFIATATLIGPSNVRASSEEKPIIVCTTEVLGSVTREMVGDQADVVVLVNPSLCPAFYDVKPSDVYAMSKAKLIFHHGIFGEMWLQDMIESSGTDAVVVEVSKAWNTPEDAKNCTSLIAESLNDVLGVDVSEKADEMANDIDLVTSKIKSEAEALDVAGVKVVCMSWQKRFVEYLGFDVVAEYGPPQRVSAGEVAEITTKAKEENVVLVIDNLQSGIDLGAKIASDVGATHVVLTNFPGAIPGTETIAKMLDYNAMQLFNGVNDYWKLQSLKSEVTTLENRVITFEAISAILAIVVIAEAVTLYARRRVRR